MNRLLKIAIVINALQRGGAERQAIMCVSELRKLGHQADLIYYHPLVGYADVLEASSIEPIYIPKSNFMFRCLRLSCLFRQKEYDVIHGFEGYATFSVAFAAKFASCRIVFGGFRNLYVLNRKFQILHRLIDKLLTGWIVNSKAIVDSMAQRIGLNANRIHVLYNGIIVQPFLNLMHPSQAKNKLMLPSDCNIVTIVARLHPQKNHKLFLDMAAQVYSRLPNTHFLIVGEGTEERKLKDYAQKSAAAANIHFLGRRTDIPDVLAATDISALTSDYEGFSNIVLEAMCAGIPVAATSYKGHDEILVHEQNALISPCGCVDLFAKNVIRLLSDDQLRHSLGNAGRNYVQQHLSPSAMAQNLETIYLKYLKGRDEDCLC